MKNRKFQKLKKLIKSLYSSFIQFRSMLLSWLNGFKILISQFSSASQLGEIGYKPLIISISTNISFLSREKIQKIYQPQNLIKSIYGNFNKYPILLTSRLNLCKNLENQALSNFSFDSASLNSIHQYFNTDSTYNFPVPWGCF